MKNNEEEMEYTNIDWTTFGLELNSAEEYRKRSSYEIKTTDDLLDPPSDNMFRHIELEAPCLRIECMQDIEKVIKGMLNPDEKLLLNKPSYFKIESGGRDEDDRLFEKRITLLNTDIMEYLQRSEEVNIEGGEGALSHNVTTHPENMVLNTLPVPPKALLEALHPSEDGPVDHLTAKLVDIINLNTRLRENKESGAPPLILGDLSELLQYHITTYLDNETPGIPPARMIDGTAMSTIAQLMKNAR